MKNLTFLSNFWRRVSAKVHGQDIGLGLRSQCSDVSLDRREHPAARCLQGPRMLTVGSPSGYSAISSGAVAMQVNPRITPFRFACTLDSLACRLRVLPSLGLRMAAMLCMLLTLSIGNAWGAVNNGDLFERISAAPAANDEVIFVNSGETVAMSTTQNSNNRGQTSITIDKTNHQYVYNSSDNAQVLTVSINSSNYSFYTVNGSTTGYMRCPSNNNYLRTYATLENSTKWTLSVSSSVFTILNVSQTSRYIAYNSGSKIFATYASGQSKPYIYKKVLSAPTALAKGTITTNSVVLTITDATNVNNYEIYHSTSSTAPTASSAATATTTSKSYTLTGLTEGTTYYVWVRAINTSPSRKTGWVALTGSSFTTTSATKVSLTKAASTNGSFTLTQGVSAVTSVTTTSAAQTVTVTGSPSAGYYLSNVTQSGASAAPTITNTALNTWTIQYAKSCTGTSTITATFSPIWYLKGDFNDWDASMPLTDITSNVATVDVSLSKTTAYEFKLYNAAEDDWYGNNGKIIDDISGWTFSTSEGDCKVFATVADDYTFNYNISTKAMQVVYPEMTHPNDAYVYLTEWWDCYVHYWYTDGGGDHALVNWGYDTQLSRDVEICGTDYWCVPILDGYPKLIMKDNAGDPSNTTGDQTTASNAGKYITHNGSAWVWNTFSTYTITFAGNGNTGGSMSDVNGICPGGSETLPANAFTKTGYTFANWQTDVAVTANSSAVSAGGTVPAGATLSSIGSNITLTAQWTANTITLNLKKNNSDASGSSDGSATINYDATATTSITAATRTGYTVEGYYTDAACTAANKVLTDAGAVVSGTVSGYTTSGKWTRATTTDLYTKWTAKTCTVTFDKNSGTGGSNSVTATYGSAMPDITPPTRSGYVFGGYYDSETSDNGTGTQYYKADGKSAKNWDKNVTSEQTLYARWYGDPKAWCDPVITITGDIHLTSYKDIYVHSTSGAGNLISISSSDFGSATHVEVAYLDADNSDAEVDKEQSVFRLCNNGSVNYNTIDGFDPDFPWGTTHSIKYTPNAYNKYDNYKLQLKIFNGDSIIKTVTHNLYGRSLPQEFVIAVKNTDNNEWYALPNTMGSNAAAQTAIEPEQIFVDNTTTPTKATFASNKTVYKGMARNTATSNVNGIRLTPDGSKKLRLISDKNYLYLPTDNSDANQVWYLKSSDFGTYQIAQDPSQSPTKKFGLYRNSGTFFGYAASPFSYNIYLLPIETKYTDIEANVTDWTGDDLQVTAAGVSAAKMKVMLEGGSESSAITLSNPATNTYLAKFDGGYDFTGKSGQTLMLKWLNSLGTMVGASMVTMPKIIVTSATSWASISPTPTINDIVVLTKPTTVGATGKAKRVELDKTNSNTGSLDISAGKELIVAETVRKFDGSSFGATGEYDININSTPALGLGALVMGTHDGTNKATVNFYTKSTGKKEQNTSVAQYVGTPFNDENNILGNWYNSWMYRIKYTSNVIGWERVNENEKMNPFEGYCVFSADAWGNDGGHSYWQQGTLVSSDNHTCSSLNWQSGVGTANENNENLLANSWMAPIHINAFVSGDFVNTVAAIYIFNSTSKSAYTSLASNYGTFTPGTADDDDVIPSMQSFSVFTNATGGSSVTLDYKKLVYDPAIAGVTTNPNFAPRRSIRDDKPDKMRLYINSENGYGDMLYLLEREDFSEGFENGWDGPKLFGESVAPQLYAITPDGNMAINCVPDWEGTVVGFRAGTEDNMYTFSFEYEGEQTWYLNDLKAEESTRILSGNTYEFSTASGDMEARFIISATPISYVPTGVENSDIRDQKSDVRKLLIDGHVYIIRNGRMYDATGVMIR